MNVDPETHKLRSPDLEWLDDERISISNISRYDGEEPSQNSMVVNISEFQQHSNSLFHTSKLDHIELSPEGNNYLGVYIVHNNLTGRDSFMIYTLNDYKMRQKISTQPFDKELVITWIRDNIVSINGNQIDLYDYVFHEAHYWEAKD